MTGSIKVTLCCEGEFIGIRTYSREHGRHGSFLMYRELAETLLNEANAKFFVDTDGGNFAKVWSVGNTLQIHIYWLNELSDGYVRGTKQAFSLPKSLIGELLISDTGTVKYLYRPSERSAKVDISRAKRTIHRILRDKLIKRAFIKAMRDSFQWPGEEVVLHNDGGYDFFFTAERSFALCGGLILHSGNRYGFPCYYYSVHT